MKEVLDVPELRNDGQNGRREEKREKKSEEGGTYHRVCTHDRSDTRN